MRWRRRTSFDLITEEIRYLSAFNFHCYFVQRRPLLVSSLSPLPLGPYLLPAPVAALSFLPIVVSNYFGLLSVYITFSLLLGSFLYSVPYICVCVHVHHRPLTLFSVVFFVPSMLQSFLATLLLPFSLLPTCIISIFPFWSPSTIIHNSSLFTLYIPFFSSQHLMAMTLHNSTPVHPFPCLVLSCVSWGVVFSLFY